jgi:hypothetical protein
MCCQYCGSSSNLEEHHIKYRSHFGKKRKKEQEDKTNKIILCNRCHRAVHDKKLVIIILFSGPVVVRQKDLNNIKEEYYIE